MDIAKLPLKDRIAYFNRMKASNAALTAPTAESARPLAPRSVNANIFPQAHALRSCDGMDIENTVPLAAQIQAGTVKAMQEKVGAVVGSAMQDLAGDDGATAVRRYKAKRRSSTGIGPAALERVDRAGDVTVAAFMSRPTGPSRRHRATSGNVSMDVSLIFGSSGSPLGLQLEKTEGEAARVLDVDCMGYGAVAGLSAGDEIYALCDIDITPMSQEELVYTMRQLQSGCGLPIEMLAKLH